MDRDAITKVFNLFDDRVDDNDLVIILIVFLLALDNVALTHLVASKSNNPYESQIM